jgi:hypothetical protein
MDENTGIYGKNQRFGCTLVMYDAVSAAKVLILSN